MKKILLLFAVIVFHYSSSAQYVTIPDNYFRAFLQAKYPACFNSAGQMNTTCTAITNEDSLEFTHQAPTTGEWIEIWGIQFFQNLRYLDLSYGRISDYAFYLSGGNAAFIPASVKTFKLNYAVNFAEIPLSPGITHLEEHHNETQISIFFPDAAKYIDVSSNQCTYLSTLPLNLDTLICFDQHHMFIQYTSLDQLPDLPSTLKYLDCSRNGLTSLPALPDGLTYLNCSNNYKFVQNPVFTSIPTLTSLPNLPSSLTYLNCSVNGMTSLPVLPTSLKYLNCQSNRFVLPPINFPGISSLPTLPNSIQHIQAGFNNISSLPALPASLAYLDVQSNPILCLPTLPANMAGVSPYATAGTNLFTNNTSISCLPNVVPGIRSEQNLTVCGPGNNPNGCSLNTPSLLLSSASATLNAQYGIPSTSTSYTISGANLSPSSGFIQVAPSANLEISTDNINFSGSAISLAYSGNTLPNTALYTRISSLAPTGSFSGTILHSGGTAADTLFRITGAITGPLLTVNPTSLITMHAASGAIQTSNLYSLFGSNLVPANGNITITPPPNFEVSPSNLPNSFNSTPFTIPYTNGSINAFHFYTRIINTTAPGPVSGLVVHTGGGAAPANLHLSGFFDSATLAHHGPTDLTTYYNFESPSTQVLIDLNHFNPAYGSFILEGSPSLEISTDNVSFTSGQILIPNNQVSLTSFPVWVRIPAGVPSGDYPGAFNVFIGDNIFSVSFNLHVLLEELTVSPQFFHQVMAAIGQNNSSHTYVLTGTNLYPASGIVSLTPGYGIEVSFDNVNFSDLPIDLPYSNHALPSRTVYFRVAAYSGLGAFTSDITHTGGNAVQDAIVYIDGNVVQPQINAGPALPMLSTFLGNPSSPATYHCAGINLIPGTGNIQIIASTGFEISLDQIQYASQLSVPYTTNAAPDFPVYARISATAPAGTLNGTIIHRGGSAQDTILNIQGVVYSPEIHAASSLQEMISLHGNPSAAQSYTVVASNLIPANSSIELTVQGPFELSTDNQTFYPQLSIPSINGTVNSITIYVRLKAGLDSGPYTGSILHSGGSAPNQTTSLQGLALWPLILASQITDRLETTLGTASPPRLYHLSGIELYPVAGDLLLHVSNGFEISTDQQHYQTDLHIPYLQYSCNDQPIYVRIKSSQSIGILSGTVTNSGGSATDTLVILDGVVFDNDIIFGPNPTTDIVTINTPWNLLPYQLAVFNSLGQRLKTMPVSTSTYHLSLKELPAGTYFIKLLHGETIIGKKIIKY